MEMESADIVTGEENVKYNSWINIMDSQKETLQETRRKG